MTETAMRHPLELVSILARATSDFDWDRLTPDQQSEERLRVRHLLQAFSHAGLSEAEAAMLVRYYQLAPDGGEADRG